MLLRNLARVNGLFRKVWAWCGADNVTFWPFPSSVVVNYEQVILLFFLIDQECALCNYEYFSFSGCFGSYKIECSASSPNVLHLWVAGGLIMWYVGFFCDWISIVSMAGSLVLH